MTDDSDEIYKETMQEVMLELKVKTDEFLKKLKEQSKKRSIHFGNM